MRPSCIFCVRKHLANAQKILEEFHTDPKANCYHINYAHGELDQAVAESIKEWPELSKQIREQRKALDDDDFYIIDFEELFDSVMPILAQVRKEIDDDSLSESEGDGQQQDTSKEEGSQTPEIRIDLSGR
jgi:hypothetical protein